MAQDFARAFYKSSRWAAARSLKVKACRGLCERCLARGIVSAGKIVHHKIYLTPENINRPEIALNLANLELLCQNCHNAEHNSREGVRYKIDSSGNVLPR